MKRRTTLSILIAMVLLVVTSFVVYAAFTVEEPFAGDVGYHKIENATLSSSIQSADLVFENPGDIVEIDYTLSNSDLKPYWYSFNIFASNSDVETTRLYKMIFVYQDNKYCGTLYEILAKQNGSINIDKMIYAGTESTDTDNVVTKTPSLDVSTFTFELHNGASTLSLSPTSVSIKLGCSISTVNMQKYIFVSNEEEFAKAVDDINRTNTYYPSETTWFVNEVDSKVEILKEETTDPNGNTVTNYLNEPYIGYNDNWFIESLDANNNSIIVDTKIRVNRKIIVLTNDIVLTKEYTLSKSGEIDFAGHKLTLNANITIDNGNFYLQNSKTTTNALISSSSSKAFIVNGTNAFLGLDIEGDYEQLFTITSYNSDALNLAIRNRIDEYEYFMNGETYNLLGLYSKYNPSISFDDISFTTANVATVTENCVAKITIGNEVLYKNVFLSDSESIYNSILTSELSFMNYYMQKEQVSTDENGNTVTDIIKGQTIKTDLFLPTAIKQYNATISWWSSDETILTNDGTVGVQQGEVELIATFKINNEVFTKTYVLDVEKQDNLNKLQYLVSEIGTIELTSVKTDLEVLPTITTAVPDGTTDEALLKQYYRYYVDGEDLGIEDIQYEIEDIYYYISLSDTTPATVDGKLDTVYLNQVTFQQYAQVKIKAIFDDANVDSNGNDIPEESYISVKIQLTHNDELLDKVFAHVQSEFDKVDVLQNVLDTRKEKGIGYESGNFTMISEYMDIQISYAVGSAKNGATTSSLECVDVLGGFISNTSKLYKKTVTIDDSSVTTWWYEDIDTTIPYEDGVNPVIGTNGNIWLGNADTSIPGEYEFDLNLEKLKLTERVVPVDVILSIGGTETKSKTLYFVIPPAITVENFKFENSMDIFRTLRYQTLEQSESPYIIINGTTYELDSINSNKLTDVQKNHLFDYNNGTYGTSKNYILLHDVQNTQKLIFQLGDTSLLLNENVKAYLEKLFEWATADDDKVVDSPVKEFLSNDVSWIQSDGESTLSDGEILVILKYCESIPSFETKFYEYIKVNDNILSDSDVALLREILTDQIFVQLLEWAMDNQGNIKEAQDILKNGFTQVQLNEILRANDSAPLQIGNYKNDGTSIITSFEEEVILYYVYVKSTTSGSYVNFDDFYDVWRIYIDNGETISLDSNGDFAYSDDLASNGYVIRPFDTANSTKVCYDPIFEALIYWTEYYVSGAKTTKTITEILTISNIKATYGLTNEEWNNLLIMLNYILDNETNTSNSYSEIASIYAYDGGLVELTAHNTSTYEWQVLQAYANRVYGLNTGVFATNYNGDLTTSSNSTTVYNCTLIGKNIGDWNRNYYSRSLSENFLDQLRKAINDKIIVNSFNSNLSNSISYDISLYSYNYSILVGGADVSISNKLYDGSPMVSYAEYLTLESLFLDLDNGVLKNMTNSYTHSLTTVNGNQQSTTETSIPNYLKTGIFKKFYLNYNLQFTTNITKDKVVSEKNVYNELLNIYEKSNDNFNNFNEWVNNSRLLQEPNISNAYYDFLNTISKDELVQFIFDNKDNKPLLNKIKNLITTYTFNVDDVIVLNTIDEIKTKVSESGTDRTLDNNHKLLDLMSSVTNYLYLPIDTINLSDVNSLECLKYYLKLIDIKLMGTSSQSLASSDSVDSINHLFDILCINNSLLQKMTINYCGITNIELIENLSYLLHLDLRGNTSLTTINPLLELKSNLNYLNVHQTGIVNQYLIPTLTKLYIRYYNDNAKKTPFYYYTENEIETLFDISNAYIDDEGNISSDYINIVNYIYLLHELNEMTYNNLHLPSSLYISNNLSIEIEWKLKSSTGTLVESIGNLKIVPNVGDKTKEHIELSSSQGFEEFILVATITVDEISFSRYFTVKVNF